MNKRLGNTVLHDTSVLSKVGKQVLQLVIEFRVIGWCLYSLLSLSLFHATRFYMQKQTTVSCHQSCFIGPSHNQARSSHNTHSCVRYKNWTVYWKVTSYTNSHCWHRCWVEVPRGRRPVYVCYYSQHEYSNDVNLFAFTSLRTWKSEVGHLSQLIPNQGQENYSRTTVFYSDVPGCGSECSPSQTSDLNKSRFALSLNTVASLQSTYVLDLDVYFVFDARDRVRIPIRAPYPQLLSREVIRAKSSTNHCADHFICLLRCEWLSSRSG